MTDNVVSLTGCAIVADGEPVPEIVEALESLLAEAKAGHIVALLLADISRANVVHTFSHWINGYMWQTLGAASLLHHELNASAATDPLRVIDHAG